MLNPLHNVRTALLHSCNACFSNTCVVHRPTGGRQEQRARLLGCLLGIRYTVNCCSAAALYVDGGRYGSRQERTIEGLRVTVGSHRVSRARRKRFELSLWTLNAAHVRGQSPSPLTGMFFFFFTYISTSWYHVRGL
jgi:hypothetical protein